MNSGIGNSDSIAVPTLIESLQHVFVKKVAVNSGMIYLILKQLKEN